MYIYICHYIYNYIHLCIIIYISIDIICTYIIIISKDNHHPQAETQKPVSPPETPPGLPTLGAREAPEDAGHAVQLPQRLVDEALVDPRLAERDFNHGKTMIGRMGRS